MHIPGFCFVAVLLPHVLSIHPAVAFGSCSVARLLPLPAVTLTPSVLGWCTAPRCGCSCLCSYFVSKTELIRSNDLSNTCECVTSSGLVMKCGEIARSTAGPFYISIYLYSLVLLSNSKPLPLSCFRSLSFIVVQHIDVTDMNPYPAAIRLISSLIHHKQRLSLFSFQQQ